ncbi:Transcriptional activator protein NhaR (plasmid) [Pseudoseohaeicola sp. NH-UV-7]|uniref:LysR family transcriptional regulator n=1 Tax=unclassified Sulfitobacter TaxID=196795 RepID=UPI000E0CA671|nr:LysR family transcriptional regulator [Sulfitobacter sp. JL08]AXI54184.1 LysR family transcriptional regulator [Sulfitobacter sp. JL08]
MPDMNFNHLRYFWQVAHDGNLTRTASRLNLSQSAVSVQIRKLEDRLGHALFERRGRQLHLTEAGRITLDYADTIFGAGQDLMATLNQTGSPRQVLRVGALATLSRNFQIEFLRPLLGQADVELVLRSGTSMELLQGLETLSLDVVLTNRVPAPDAMTAFIAHPVSEQPVSVIGTPARIGQAETLQALLMGHPIIVPTKESPVRTGFDTLCERLDISPVLAAEVDDMAMMRLLAREDIGLAVLPPIVVKNELATGLLKEADHLVGLTESFHAVTVKRKFPNPLLAGLLAPPQAGVGL